MDTLPEKKRGFSGLQVLGIVVGVMLLTVVVTIFSIKAWLFPHPFKPVVLDQKEQQKLEQKLNRFESFAALPAQNAQAAEPAKTPPPEKDFARNGRLNPQAYSEEGASREISFTEREINGMLAKNTDLARKLAIDLANDLISLRMLVPVDPDFPILGGKIIRAKAGAELAYRNSKPVVILKGVSLMGVPIPNAWLGGLKNIDLVQEFGGNEGLWKSFSEGVETIKVKDGQLYIKLKE
ncbi:MAG: arginine N-succinyltransferase [Desulfobulbus sp.]|nr:MAG: arginine N-succinyltransferase [Desulfobulbus sp.]RUM41259.1 MAG: arginine N-succinyltransferase [Desulfobulbus sp.]